MPTRHLKTISSLSPEEFVQIIDLSIAIKKNPEKYTTALANKTLLAIFAKPSLRTRVSLETAMTKLGGHTIYYQLGAGSPLGVKETYGDTGGVISRMVDACSARVYSRNEINELSDACSIPVINALDDWGHPLQMVCDFITIKEKFGGFKTKEGKPLHFMYAGDSLNNVTYDLMRACSLVGMHCHVACPDNKDYAPVQDVLDECAAINATTGGAVTVHHDILEASKGCHICYADSWFSYGIPLDEKEERMKWLSPFQINDATMAVTAEESIFMNCLPAMRGYEQTAEVIDGPKSIIFDQAENRLWSSMGVLITFIGWNKDVKA